LNPKVVPPSPTQRQLTASDVATLVRASFGPRAAVADAAPLTGGGFAAVWRVRLDDGRDTVLKVGPPPSVRLLSYETDLLAAEAAYFRLVRDAGVPVPHVLHYGADSGVLDGEWLFTGFLDGTALPALPATANDAGARYDAGAAVARVHRLTGNRYGYTGNRTHAATWRLAFTAIIDELLTDAAAWNVTLPVPVDRIRDVVARHAPVLDIVDRPALLHFDLWDGNLLAAIDAGGTTRLTGLVDGERHLYGDWLLDLVSPCLLRRIEDEPHHPFLRGYAAETGEPFVADETVRRRLTLYRLHLYLIMLIEIPSRGMTGPYADARRARLNPLFQYEFATLVRPSLLT
jgi:aminoglycoside phosphotransferase (APT) family kinase protein